MKTNTVSISQKVSESTKRNKDWYILNFDYFKSACVNQDDHSDIETYYDILLNGLSEKEYHYVMNPYNNLDERYMKLPGKIRNIDIITPLLERYIGEYISQYDNFVITNIHPKAIEEREAKVTAEAIKVIGDLFMEEMSKRMESYKAELAQNPNAEPQSVPPQIEKNEVIRVVEKARESWSRQQTIKNKRMLKLLNKITDADEKYIDGFFHWFMSGRVVSYHDVRKDDVMKEIIHPLEYKRYGGARYIEDDIAGLRTYRLSIEELEEQLEEDLEPKTLKALRESVEAYSTTSGIVIPIIFARDRFDIESRGNKDYVLSSNNGVNIEHLVWFSKTKYYELSEDLVNINDFIQLEQLVFTEEEYKKASIIIPEENFTVKWVDEYWEQYRFGENSNELYTVPRPLKVQESDIKESIGVKSPYNGVYGDIKNMNTSKFKRLIPYQALVNVFFLQLDRTIAKNLDKIMVIPESILTGTNEYTKESRLYYLKADNKLIINDIDIDANEVATLGQTLKILDGSLDKYINGLIEIIEYTKKLAWDEVAMNEERYGNINSGAGKAVTEQTIFRSSLGSRLTFDVYNTFVAKDHEKALNYSRVAYPDGKTEAIIEDGKVEFVTIGGGNGVLDDIGVSVKYSAMERENIQAAKQGAFSIYQNDQPELATAVLQATSMDEITEIMKEYSKIKREYETANQSNQANLDAMLIQKETERIDKEKEWDYKITTLKEESENARKEFEINFKTLELQSGKDVEEPIENTDIDERKLDIEDRKVNILEKAQANLVAFQRRQLDIKQEELKIKEKALNKPKPS